MLPQEIHALVKTYLQELNSDIYNTPLPEVIDLAFNVAVMDYIRGNIGDLRDGQNMRKFEVQTEGTDLFEPLWNNHTETVKRETNTLSYIHLPGDSFRFIKSVSKLLNFCNVTTLTTSNVTKYVVEIEIPDDVTATPYAAFNLIVQGSGEVLFNLLSFTGLANLNNVKEKYKLYNWIMESINEQTAFDCEVYWQSYNGTFKNNTLFVVADATFDLDMQYTAVPSTILNDTPVVHVVRDFSAYTETQYRNYPNRLVSSAHIDDLAVNPFGSTRYNSPITYMINGKLYISHTESFVPAEVTIRYIRKPNLLDLSSSRNVNLSRAFVDIIARLTAQQIALFKGNITAENIMRANVLLD